MGCMPMQDIRAALLLVEWVADVSLHMASTAYTVYPRSSSSSSSSLSPNWCGDTEGTWRCLLFSSGWVGVVGLCTELSPEAERSSTRRFGRKPSLAEKLAMSRKET